MLASIMQASAARHTTLPGPAHPRFPTPLPSRHRPSCARQVVLLGRGGLLCRAVLLQLRDDVWRQVGAQAERFGYSKLRCPEEESGLASSSQQFSASILSKGVGIGASRERA